MNVLVFDLGHVLLQGRSAGDPLMMKQLSVVAFPW